MDKGRKITASSISSFVKRNAQSQTQSQTDWYSDDLLFPSVGVTLYPSVGVTDAYRCAGPDADKLRYGSIVYSQPYACKPIPRSEEEDCSSLSSFSTLPSGVSSPDFAKLALKSPKRY